MLTLGHAGLPPEPHDLWGAWNLDPLLIVGLLLAMWCYRRGSVTGSRRDRWRAAVFAAALVVLAVALVSPLDALAAALASAHMIQHVLLILVAAPLLALSAPGSTLLRGSPLVLRKAMAGARRWVRARAIATRLPSHPAVVWPLHAGTLWLWHAAVLYDAALARPVVHVAEHVTFLLTAVLFWRVVVGLRNRVVPGLAMLLVFGMALQSTFLALLLTFAGTPWYDGYRETTSAWGLTPLADQQLAGVIMWVPAGFVYVASAIALLAVWLRGMEGDESAPALSHRS